MLGKRLEKANLVAEKRFKKRLNWGWFNGNFSNKLDFDKIKGSLRKTGTECSCEMCRNERRCSWTKKSEKPTIQERKAPDVDDFWEDLQENL
jgi:hypothetical protein